MSGTVDLRTHSINFFKIKSFDLRAAHSTHTHTHSDGNQTHGAHVLIGILCSALASNPSGQC